MRTRMTLGLTAAFVLAAACQEEKRACPEFDTVQTEFDDLAARIVDPEFKDPAFVAIAEKFEAIPSQCQRYDQAVATARMLRSAQPGAAPKVERKGSKPKAGPGPRSRFDFTNGVLGPGFHCRVSAGLSGRTLRHTCRHAKNKNAALDACVAWARSRLHEWKGVRLDNLYCDCYKERELRVDRHCPDHQPYM